MLCLTSTVTKAGKVVLALTKKDVPTLKENEVLIRVEAAPINPSDCTGLLALADPSTVVAGEVNGFPCATCDIPEKFRPSSRGRVEIVTPVGNEGAGTVVSTGSSAEAKALMGKTVALMGGAMYAELRKAKVDDCLVLPRGITAAQGASCFVNPLTVLGFVETMKAEGHTAMIHTAAASNLGQMLVKVCMKDKIPLINVVRKQQQEELLRSIGAEHVLRSDRPTFVHDLAALAKTLNATIAFDAIGGGDMVGILLTAMEIAQGGMGVYGSTVHKQVYIYGGLDRGPTVFNRSFGMQFGIGGWLMPTFCVKVGPEKTRQLKERIAREIDTTFASSYAREASLEEVLRPENLRVWAAQETGQKFLVVPSKKTSRL